MRPTTKDLARAAGVSLATVDRVLNGRAGVRQATVDAVNDAIERLGFVRNLSAANLARSRTYRFRFLLPRSGDLFLDSVVSHIEEARQAFAAEFVNVDHRREIGSDPHQIARVLSEIDLDTLDGVALMAPESPQVRDATARLRERGVHVVQFVSGQPGDRGVDFVGVDNRAAGATAGRILGRFCAGRGGEILVITETMNARDSLERRHGFDLVLGRDFPNLTALPTLESHGDAERARLIVRNAYANHRAIIGAYVLSSEARLALEAIAAVSDPTSQVIIAHERTRFSEALLCNGQLDAVIAQNPGHLVRSAIRVLRARCDDREPIASQEEIRIEILLQENLGDRFTARRA
ncbi:LacI family DNA-binding transcriptional regulator [Chthonobacter rhizosphaerae]|uniref:LacI family DNA-binding transcriptional regulator n=1 Tax=Chthonobacter rhizosphaerae TaxID=2735553 RepID=UPI0015EF2016|nr:LacI family DNA-binding transcriptional regulator [Chthonobacter rhizosphaerae]